MQFAGLFEVGSRWGWFSIAIVALALPAGGCASDPPQGVDANDLDVAEDAFAKRRPEKRVQICHKKKETLSVAQAAVSAHLRHGDKIGPCKPPEKKCDDGNLCTTDTRLPNGKCDHAPVTCDDGNVCTRDSCERRTGCVYAAIDGLACSDGNACTGADTCKLGQCTGSAIAGCCSA